MINKEGLVYLQGNGLKIGYVSEILGPNGDDTPVKVTREEVEILARYYMNFIAQDEVQIAYGQCGGSMARSREYGWRRINAFVDAGLFTEGQLRALYDEIVPSEEELAKIRVSEERRYGETELANEAYSTINTVFRGGAEARAAYSNYSSARFLDNDSGDVLIDGIGELQDGAPVA